MPSPQTLKTPVLMPTLFSAVAAMAQTKAPPAAASASASKNSSDADGMKSKNHKWGPKHHKAAMPRLQSFRSSKVGFSRGASSVRGHVTAAIVKAGQLVGQDGFFSS